MQKESDSVIDALFTQFSGKRQQVVIVDPQDIVRLDQRFQSLRQQGIHAAVTFPLHAGTAPDRGDSGTRARSPY